MPSARRFRNWPCVFGSRFIRDVVDPRVQSCWQSYHGDSHPPFGDLRQQWKGQHCRTLNPYGSESCPYSEQDCAMAFLSAVQQSADKRSPVGYFKKVAKTMALHRAENKPLARDAAPRPGRPAAPAPGPDAGLGMPSPFARPSSVGDVLRSLDLGPRPPAQRRDEGEAGSER